MKTTFLVSALCLAAQLATQAASSIYAVDLKDIDDKPASLKTYEGKVMLIVNVASQCGYTKQYTGLEALQQKYKDKGLTVLGFPCNQFGGQEPGANQEIKQFCSSKFNVTFPMFSKIEVNGPNRHPLYELLAGKDSMVSGDIRWNFTKFLIGRDGKVLKRFEPATTPESAELTGAIETALAAK